jgi:hypothetical protein
MGHRLYATERRRSEKLSGKFEVQRKAERGDEMRNTVAGIFLMGALVWVLAAGAQAGSAKPEGKALSAYSIVVVDKFTVDPAAYQNGYIKGEETVMQQEFVEKLRKKKNLFDQVLDGTDSPDSVVPAVNAAEKPTVIVTGVVTEFKPGNAAKRALIGYGAGHSTLKMTFTFHDVASRKQVLELEEKSLYLGGGINDNKVQAATQTAEYMVNELVRDIKKNR